MRAHAIARTSSLIAQLIKIFRAPLMRRCAVAWARMASRVVSNTSRGYHASVPESPGSPKLEELVERGARDDGTVLRRTQGKGARATKLCAKRSTVQSKS